MHELRGVSTFSRAQVPEGIVAHFADAVALHYTVFLWSERCDGLVRRAHMHLRCDGAVRRMEMDVHAARIGISDLVDPARRAALLGSAS